MPHLGRTVILLSSYTNSPRQMFQLYQDAMTIVRKYGKPDLFITFTCNPLWDDITSNLLPNQKVTDRPGLVVSVFKLKLREQLNDILKRHIQGRTLAHVYTIEFQKRGLPHGHLMYANPANNLITIELCALKFPILLSNLFSIVDYIESLNVA